MLRAEALVVGGSIHDRLQRRQDLRAMGFHVTIDSSLHRGLQRLRRYPFAVCELDLSGIAAPRRWRREFQAASRQLGSELRDLTRDDVA